MTINALRYSGYPALFNYGGSSLLSLVQLGGYSLDAGARLQEIVPAGSVDRAAVILAGANPTCRISSEDLASIFAAVSPTAGLLCTSSMFQYQKRLDGAIFASGSSHVTAVAQKGFLCPQSLSASGDSPAQCELMFYPLFDGTNDPLLFTDSEALTGTPAFSSQYFLGPLYLGSSPVQLQGLTQTRINFGITFQLFKGDGLVYPAQGAISQRKPTISLTLTKVSAAPGQLASMFNNAASNLAAYFAQGVPGSTRVANGTAGHVKASFSTGAWQARSVSVQGEQDSEIVLEAQITGTIGLSIASTIP